MEQPCVSLPLCRATTRRGLSGSSVLDAPARGLCGNVDNDLLEQPRWLCNRRDFKEAQQNLAEWLTLWETRYPKRTVWVEGYLSETGNFYRLPRQHHNYLKLTNLRERLAEETKHRNQVVPIFSNLAKCLRLIRALCAETHEAWIVEDHYLHMDLLKVQRKDLLPTTAGSMPTKTSAMNAYWDKLTHTI